MVIMEWTELNWRFALDRQLSEGVCLVLTRQVDRERQVALELVLTLLTAGAEAQRVPHNTRVGRGTNRVPSRVVAVLSARVPYNQKALYAGLLVELAPGGRRNNA